MATEFIMPKLGLTMESGTIGSWLVADGTAVVVGDAVASVETDKVVTDIESSGTGILRHVGTEGTSYDCGVLIGWICAPGEEPPQPAMPAAPVGGASLSPSAVGGSAAAVGSAGGIAVVNRDGGRLFASPNAKRIAASLGVPLAVVTGTGPGGRIVSEDVDRASAAGVRGMPAVAAQHVAPAGSPGAWGTVSNATFAAVQLAKMLGLDTEEVPTAAVDGVVTREDVAEHARALIARGKSAGVVTGAVQTSAAPAAPVVHAAAAQSAGTAAAPAAVGLSPMRRVISQRMSESLHGMAQLTLAMDVDMAVVMADRRGRQMLAADAGVPGYTDYVIKACAIALERHPHVNASLTQTGITMHTDINIGMAVAVDGGLLVPVVRSADALPLHALSDETTRLATAARANRLALQEMEGGTFSVSALGMFGVDMFTPIINPPNAAILGVGRIRTDTAWTDGAASPVSRMTLSLTWDHRVFDGAPAAEFAREIKNVLEDPSRWPTA